MPRAEIDSLGIVDHDDLTILTSLEDFNMSELDFIKEIIDQFFLPPEEIEKIADALSSNHKRIFQDYMALKMHMYSESRLYKYETVSLGQNCLPHSVPIRVGLKFPGFIRKEKRLFCDLGVTNIRGMVQLFNSNLEDCLLCDGITGNNFQSSKYNFEYNHDHLVPNKNLEDSLHDANLLFMTRLQRLIAKLTNGNCLCISCCYYKKMEDTADDLLKLYDEIKMFNTSNELFVIDIKGDFGEFAEVHPLNYLKISLPYEGFIWHRPKFYLTSDGYKFISTIAEALLTFIKKYFPSKAQATDAIALSLEANSYKNLLINYYRDLYLRNRTIRLDISNLSESATCGISVRCARLLPENIKKNPSWLPNGVSIKSSDRELDMVIVCKGTGVLNVDLLGIDARNADKKRYPIWIDCNYLQINKKIIFKSVKTVCYSRRYKYSKNVTAGEKIHLICRWTECQSPTIVNELKRLETENKIHAQQAIEHAKVHKEKFERPGQESYLISIASLLSLYAGFVSAKTLSKITGGRIKKHFLKKRWNYQTRLQNRLAGYQD